MATRIKYDEELRDISSQIRAMGTEVKRAIDMTVEAFSRLDTETANQIMQHDDIIDHYESLIEERCIEIVVKQAPIASDWRKIASYMRMISDLERIADNCSDISMYIKRIAAGPEVHAPVAFTGMFDTMRDMVSDTIESFFKGDTKLAAAVIRNDEVVDRDFDVIMKEISAEIQKNPEHTDQYLDYLMINKYVERMADHSANIASWVTFIVKGQLRLQYTDRYRKNSEN